MIRLPKGLLSPRILRLVRSIQTGTITITGTSASATITAVNTAHSVLINLGSNAPGSDTSFGHDTYGVGMTLASATSVSAGCGAASANDPTCRFAVIEFWPNTPITAARLIRSIQYGSINSSSTSANATVTSVNTAKSILLHLGTISNATPSEGADTYMTALTLSNATTVNVSKSQSIATCTTYFCLVEFW